MTEPKKRGNVQDAWARWKFTVLKIGELFDVDTSAGPTSGQTLLWNSTDKKWEPGSAGSVVENVNTVSASGSSQTLPDVTSYTMHDITLTANCTFTFPSLGAGKSFRVLARQDGTGGRKATWPTTVEWPNGVKPTLTATANAKDWLDFRCWDGSKWEGRATLDLQVPTLRVVQTAIGGGGGTGITASFSGAPIAGNVIVAVVSKYNPRSIDPNPGTGWVQQVSSTSSGNASTQVYTRIVQSGDGATWTFDEFAGFTDGFSVGLFEVAGSDSTPGGWSYPTQGASSSPLSQSVTATAGTLLLVGFCPNGGTTFGGLSTMTPSGYSSDRQYVNASSDSLTIGHTSATGSAQSIGTSWNGTNGDAIQVVIAVSA